MSNRSLYLLAGTIGSTIGGLVPGLWGAGTFSVLSVVLGTLGGIAGIVLAYKIITA